MALSSVVTRISPFFAGGVLGSALVAGCGRPVQPALVVSPVATSTAGCLAPGSEPQGRDVDLDGDGTPDRLVSGYRNVTLYLRRGGCFTMLATIDPEGPVAFVHVNEPKGAGIRDLSIETWLVHGDRRRTQWSWIGGAFQRSGADEEILGPHR